MILKSRRTTPNMGNAMTTIETLPAPKGISGHRVVTLLCVALLCSLGLNAVAADPSSDWRVGPAAWSFRKFTFFEAVDKTASLGMPRIEAFEGQQVRPDSDAKLDAKLPDEAIEEIRAKLKETKVELTSIYIHKLPAGEAACRKAFEFARKLGVEFIVSEPEPEALDVIEQCCNEYAINLAIHNHPQGGSRYWNPDEVLRVCEGRGPRIGACGDTGHWLRSELNPAESVRKLGKRLISLHVKDLDKAAPDAVDVPWGQGCGEIGEVLRTLHELRLSPALFAIEYESHWENNLTQIRACEEWFEETVAALAEGAKR